MVNKAKERFLSFDYLRAFLMFLVIMHHSFLAYTPSGYGALINDPNNVKAFEVITGYLDTFFMSLFFLISGLFTLRSLEGKGALKFISDRFIRLILPFVLGILIINVVGYYLSFMAGYNLPLTWQNFGDYFWGSLAMVPAGPLWFLWVLFVFDIIIALVYNVIRSWNERIQNSKSKFFTQGGRFLLLFIIFGFIAYTVVDIFSPYGFIVILPPFEVQISRIGMYFFFFLTGAMLGVFGIERSVIGRNSGLSKAWWLLLPLSVFATVALKIVVDIIIKGGTAEWLTTTLIYFARLGLVLSCVFASFGFLGLFNRIARRGVKFFDIVAKNAMGIYIVHYTIVTVFQYLLLKASIGGAIKGIAVTLSSFLVSLGLVLILKTIPGVRLSVGGLYKGKAKSIVIALTSALLAVIVIMNVVK